MSDQQQLARRPKFSFGSGTFASDVGLAIVDGLGFDAWVEIGERVRRFSEASAWWIGDWGAYGDYRYGEKYALLIEQLDLQYDQIRNYIYVAANVPLTVRRGDLSWSHHRAVAKLAPSDQERWLARAADEGWSFRQLRDAIAGTETALRSAVLEQLRFTIEPARLERWQTAAQQRGLSVQEWATATLDKEADQAWQTT